MPDKKITDLVEATSLSLTDLLVGVTDPAGDEETEKFPLQDVRDLFDRSGIYHRLDGTPHAEDDEFDGDLSDWNQIIPDGSTAPAFSLSGSAVHMVRNGATGQPTADALASYLKPLVGSAGSCTIETCMSGFGPNVADVFQGLIFSNGEDPQASNIAGIGIKYTDTGIFLAKFTGQHELITMTTTQLYSNIPNDKIFMRLNWSSSNTFTPSFSHNGLVYDDLGVSPISFTLTPNRYGFSYGWTSASEPILTWEYFRKIA